MTIPAALGVIFLLWLADRAARHGEKAWARFGEKVRSRGWEFDQPTASERRGPFTLQFRMRGRSFDGLNWTVEGWRGLRTKNSDHSYTRWFTNGVKSDRGVVALCLLPLSALRAALSKTALSTLTSFHKDGKLDVKWETESGPRVVDVSSDFRDLFIALEERPGAAEALLNGADEIKLRPLAERGVDRLLTSFVFSSAGLEAVTVGCHPVRTGVEAFAESCIAVGGAFRGKKAG